MSYCNFKYGLPVRLKSIIYLNNDELWMLKDDFNNWCKWLERNKAHPNNCSIGTKVIALCKRRKCSCQSMVAGLKELQWLTCITGRIMTIICHDWEVVCHCLVTILLFFVHYLLWSIVSITKCDLALQGAHLVMCSCSFTYIKKIGITEISKSALNLLCFVKFGLKIYLHRTWKKDE